MPDLASAKTSLFNDYNKLQRDFLVRGRNNGQPVAEVMAALTHTLTVIVAGHFVALTATCDDGVVLDGLRMFDDQVRATVFDLRNGAK